VEAGKSLKRIKPLPFRRSSRRSVRTFERSWRGKFAYDIR
jgi:hypothetical protein